MPTIEISDEDFARMQRLAEPLIDTPTSFVSKMLDRFEDSESNSTSGVSKTPGFLGVFPFDSAPPLVHVKLISGIIGVRSPKKASWDSMVALCLEMVTEQQVGIEQVGTLIDLNVVGGKKSNEGYKFLPKLNRSYQGVSAQHAATVIGKTARFLREGAHVDFVWRQKEGAHAPGQTAALSYDLRS